MYFRNQLIWLFWIIIVVGAASSIGSANEDEQSDQMQQSTKPVASGGLDFEVVAIPTWVRPLEIYEQKETRIGLRISNPSKCDMTMVFDGEMRLSLKSEAGQELVTKAIPRRFLPVPLVIKAGKEELVELPSSLFHTRIGDVCVGLQDEVGWNWITHDIMPGKFRLSIELNRNGKGNGDWHGQLKTGVLDIVVQ